MVDITSFHGKIEYRKAEVQKYSIVQVPWFYIVDKSHTQTWRGECGAFLR